MKWVVLRIILFSLNSKLLKLVDHVIYLGSIITFTESVDCYIETPLQKKYPTQDNELHSMSKLKFIIPRVPSYEQMNFFEHFSY